MTAAALGIVTFGALKYASVDARKIGRTDPKRAAHYRPILFNFSETYTDGSALGVAVGSTKQQAIEAAEGAGFVVEPSGWGDNRAGGTELYSRATLLRTMLKQTHLAFYDPRDLSLGIIVNFREDRVGALHVHYINFEAI